MTTYKQTRYRIIKGSRDGAFLIINNMTGSKASKELNKEDAIKRVNQLNEI